jgi:hypothetical protein
MLYREQSGNPACSKKSLQIRLAWLERNSFFRRKKMFSEKIRLWSLKVWHAFVLEPSTLRLTTVAAIYSWWTLR